MIDARKTEIMAEHSQPNYWALAARPDKYRILEAINNLPIDWWRTKNKPISLGDQMVIWQYRDSEQRRGVVALGEIVAGPKIRADGDNPYHIDPNHLERDAQVERVGVHYTPLSEPMWVGGPQDELVTSLSVSRAHGGTVFRVTPDQWNAIVSARGHDADLDTEKSADVDIEEIRSRTDLNPTEREALVQARRGQGRFRQDLLERWRGCAVVGSTVQSILRASHIKPWRELTDTERLDPANGLPLTANLDALFNDGLITFDDHGEMLISPRLSRKDRSLLQLSGKLRKRPMARQIAYLAYHRDRVFRPYRSPHQVNVR